MYNDMLKNFITEKDYDNVCKIINLYKLNTEFQDDYKIDDGEKTYLKNHLKKIELILIYNWNDDILHNKNFARTCQLYIDIVKLLPLPEDDIDKVYHMLKFISFGYLGESWESVRRFVFNNKTKFEVNIDDEIWPERLLKTIYMAICYLLKKENWLDLDRAIKMINVLKEEQREFEKTYLESYDQFEVRSASYELAALYHIAKSVELVGEYQLRGRPTNLEELLNGHFQNSLKYTDAGNLIDLQIISHSLLSMLQKMIHNSLWSVIREGNETETNFINKMIHDSDPVIEFMYPQRYSLIENNLLSPAHKAVVINLPTSSGKTLISEFKILQTLNHFSEEKGWIAYIAPTRALVNQITIKLRQELGREPINIKIEKISGAMEIDTYEENIMKESNYFDILVTTPEKMSLLIRQDIEKKIGRKLVLVVVDEAQNISSGTRGINLETLLSMIKNDCEDANYLLMSPLIPNPDDLAKWLDEDNPKDISVGLQFWRPNDMIVGIHYGEGSRKNYKIKFKPMIINNNKTEFKDDIIFNMDPSTRKKELTTKYKLTALLASQLKQKENVLIISGTKKGTFDTADYLYDRIEPIEEDADISLIKAFIAQELGSEFPLVKYLDKGIAIHHAGLPDDIRFLVEHLMRKNKISYLISTTTTAQGINFPVSTILLASYAYPWTSHMPPSDFWNLAGRVGRVYSDSPGIVSLAVKDNVSSEDGVKAMRFINLGTKELISNLVRMVDDALEKFNELNLESLYVNREWSTFIQYISHMSTQTANLEEYIAQIENTLKLTYGYDQLSEENKRLLTTSVVVYAQQLSQDDAKMSDNTGFSSITIKTIAPQISEGTFTTSDFSGAQLFKDDSESLRELIGIMLKTPEISKDLKDIKIPGTEYQYNSLSRLITDWVNGKDIQSISSNIFGNSNHKTITDCVNAIYGKLALSASWGLSSFQKILSAVVEFDQLNEIELKHIQNVPAMIYYGVNTDEAVLMRKASVPRSISPNMGLIFAEIIGEERYQYTASQATEWLSSLPINMWNSAAPYPSTFSGSKYKQIWDILIGKI